MPCSAPICGGSGRWPAAMPGGSSQRPHPPHRPLSSSPRPASSPGPGPGQPGARPGSPGRTHRHLPGRPRGRVVRDPASAATPAWWSTPRPAGRPCPDPLAADHRRPVIVVAAHPGWRGRGRQPGHGHPARAQPAPGRRARRRQEQRPPAPDRRGRPRPGRSADPVRPQADRAGRLAEQRRPAGRPQRRAIDVLKQLISELDDRYLTLLANRARKVTKGDDLPLHLVGIEELAYFTSGPDHQPPSLLTLLRDFVAEGRAAGMITVATTQKPSADVVPTFLRDLFGFRWALLLLHPPSVRHDPRVGLGVRGLLGGQHRPGREEWGCCSGWVPVRLRSCWLDDLDLAELAHRGRAAPWGDQADEGRRRCGWSRTSRREHARGRHLPQRPCRQTDLLWEDSCCSDTCREEATAVRCRRRLRWGCSTLGPSDTPPTQGGSA